MLAFRKRRGWGLRVLCLLALCGQYFAQAGEVCSPRLFIDLLASVVTHLSLEYSFPYPFKLMGCAASKSELPSPLYFGQMVSENAAWAVET